MFAFFALLASYSAENKMNTHNIAVVMAPIMLTSSCADPQSLMANQSTVISIIQEMIDHKSIFTNIRAKRLDGSTDS